MERSETITASLIHEEIISSWDILSMHCSKRIDDVPSYLTVPSP